MKNKLIFFFSLSFLTFLNGQFIHSVYVAPGINVYHYIPSHQNYKVSTNHKFKTNWQSTAGYRLKYTFNRFSIYTTVELKYSKIKFIQFSPSLDYSGELINAEASLGFNYKIYKKINFGFDFKQIRELSATGLFFKRYFDLDENYNGFSLSLLYQINKHFEVGSYYNLTLDSQYKSLSKTWGNTLDGFIHKVYLRNLDLRFYYNF
ncbi:MAG: hypothetical protein WAS56_05200 [Saprospiraceae bacterium]